MALTPDLADVRRPQPRLSLQRVDVEQQRLCEQLVQLTPAQFEQPSNLPGWSVFDLGVHITRVCDSIQLAAQRASVGDQTPAFGAAAKPREEAIRAMPPNEWVTLQRSAYHSISQLVAELSDEQLEQFDFPHPQGQRSIRWFCTQLLAESAFHRWDLARSLGGQASLDDSLAAYLLPFLLDPAEPLFGSLRAASDTQTFRLETDSLTFFLASTPTGTRVESTPIRDAPLIRARPGWLALAVYGRVRIEAPTFEITGPQDTADRFAAIFGPK